MTWLAFRAFLGRVPRSVWIGLGAALLIGLAVWRGLHWYHGQIDDAEKRGEARAYANVEKQAAELTAKANALNDKLAAALREKNREENARIAAAADSLRLHGPGAARCSAVAFVPTGAGGHVAAGGKPDAAGPQVPSDERAAVPWGWLVGRAEEHDLNRAEALAWREWYARFSAEWAKWNADAAKARSAPAK